MMPQVSKKVGLARLAKTKSLTIDGNTDHSNSSDDASNIVVPNILVTTTLQTSLGDCSDSITKKMVLVSPETQNSLNEFMKNTDMGITPRTTMIHRSQTVHTTETDSAGQTSSSEYSTQDESVTQSPEFGGLKKSRSSTGINFIKGLHKASFRKKKQKANNPFIKSENLNVPKRMRSISMNNLNDSFLQAHMLGVHPSQIQSNLPYDGSGSGSNSSLVSTSSGETEPSMQLNVPKALAARSLSMSYLLQDSTTPLSKVTTSGAKQKNYLFGGLTSLLGAQELERYFPDRTVKIFIATWNMNGKQSPTTLDDFLLPDDMEHMPDMYVIGTQESDNDINEFQVRLQTTIGPSHVLFSSAVFGILHLSIFLRRDLVWFCSVPEEESHSLRPGTYFKTKGAVALGFQFFGTRMLFINTHLFAHEEKLQQRVQNYKAVIRNLDLPKNLKGNKLLKHKDVSKRYDVVFWLGDLNFRLVGDRDMILKKLADTCTPEEYEQLLEYDQLTNEKKKGELFHGFNEGTIRFAPTFKFDVGTNRYDSSSKQRVPSYTDRILYRANRDPIHCMRYEACHTFKTSDHKPVWGIYDFKVRPGKDDVPLAAGLFKRDVYLEALRRRRRLFYQQSSKNCKVQ